jgi:hypothetical protein
MTVEQTSKELKAWLLAGAALFLFGIPVLAYGVGVDEHAQKYGIILMSIGVLWVIFIKGLIWWRHG